MPTSTDTMYDAESRYIHQIFKIYFSESDPLEVTKENYLISSSFLEESYKLSDSPFGDVSSNETSFTLYNENGLFNPSNRDSKYYGRIKKGIKIEAFIRPDESDEWDPMGVFYVDDWYTSSSGVTAEVTAHDALYNVLNGSVPSFPVFRNITFATFMSMYFSYFGYDADIDPSVDLVIPYVYTSAYSNNKAFLSDILKAALADCFCDHAGRIKVVSKVSARPKRAALTDDNQIINISIKQSITTDYDSVTVEYNKGQESNEQPLVELNAFEVSPGINSTGKLSLSRQPVLSIRSLKTTCADAIRIVSFNASANELTASLQSTVDASTRLDIVGTVLDSVKFSIGEAVNAPLEIKSLFIQEIGTALNIKDYAQAYIDANMPTLELSIRGNPRLQLGDKIEIDSAYYKVKYIGVIVMAKYEYEGSLSCSLTLVDASKIREV